MSVRLINDDCLRVLPRLERADLVFVDLPYGMTQNAWDSIIPFEPMWREVWRMQVSAAVFTAIQPFASALVMSQPAHFKHEWVWEKNKATGHLNAKKAPMRAHESILVFANSKCPYTPQMTDGHEPGHTATRRTYTPNYGAQRPTDYGGSTQRYPRSVQRFNIINNDDPEKVHPTQKPVGLVRYFIETYSRPGDLVLDFCMGSGTTGVAALQCGRRFIGIESDITYFTAASNRIFAEQRAAA